MSYPRVERIVDNHKNEVILSFYTNNQSIEFNKDLCVGCYVCTKVCPQEAIVQRNHEVIRKKTEDLFPDIPDAEKCSYCGTCAYMCLFSAITLKKDGKPVKLESCMSCFEVCPTGAFIKADKVNDLGKKRKVDFNVRATCVVCGACENACSVDAIKVKVDKIYYSGEFKKQFWTELIRRSEKDM